MSFDILDLDPLELLACALTAVMLAVPLAFPLAASVISGPRSRWGGAGLAVGLSLLVGVVLAAGLDLAGARGLLSALSGLALMAGLACAIVAAVLVVVLADGTTWSFVIGVIACVLIGLGEPGQLLPAMYGISSSTLVVLSAMVIEAVAAVALTAFLVAGAGRVRALQIGIAAAGVVAALLSLVALGVELLHEWAQIGLPGPSLPVILVLTLAALALGSVTSGVIDAVKSRGRRPASSPRS